MNLTTAADLGRVVRARRRDLGYTQQQLADRADVARQWIVRLENGRGRAEFGPLLRTLLQLDLELRLEPIDPDDDLEEYVQSFGTGTTPDEARP